MCNVHILAFTIRTDFYKFNVLDCSVYLLKYRRVKPQRITKFRHNLSPKKYVEINAELFN